ncbi:MAG: flagellar basal body P-ring formation chaperone FlgA, partial [Tepidisphaeraceae bacterium]
GQMFREYARHDRFWSDAGSASADAVGVPYTSPPPQKRAQQPVLLCLATQLLLAQSCHADDVLFQPDAGSQRFIATDSPRIITLELKEEATVYGPAVRLKHVIRCSEADAVALDHTLDLIICKLEKPKQVAILDLFRLKKTLEDSGVNLLAIHFQGVTECKVSRMDDPAEAQLKERVQEGIRAALAAEATTRPAVAASSSIPPLNPGTAAAGPFHTLRDLLSEEVAERFSLDPESLSMRFRPEDEKLVGLSEPACRFSVMPRKQSNIGDLTWDVLITSQGSEKKVAITASVKLWRTQIVTTRALAFRQMIREDDIKEARILVDRLGDDYPLTKDQVVGCETARDIGPGVVLNNRLIQATLLVRTGQLINITVDRGGIVLKWVAEARENGVFGQIIRIRRPGTREEFQARISGEEQATLVGGGDAAPVAAGR